MTGGRERQWRFYKVLFLLEFSRSGKRKDGEDGRSLFYSP